MNGINQSSASVAALPSGVRVAGQPKFATEIVAEPLTGGQFTFGKNDESAVRIAVEDVNRASAAANRRSVAFEVLSEDDAVGREPGAYSVQKLVYSGDTTAIGRSISGVIS
ncbi:hypothetical protein VSR82_38965 [Burkholderia sp. JPY481]|uniref:hypothetical protein n=1 Tax=unclassified Paraburkholderia TaxID=2615204 RepID=UPI003173957C